LSFVSFLFDLKTFLRLDPTSLTPARRRAVEVAQPRGMLRPCQAVPEHDGTACCGRNDDQRGARFRAQFESRHYVGKILHGRAVSSDSSDGDWPGPGGPGLVGQHFPIPKTRLQCLQINYAPLNYISRECSCGKEAVVAGTSNKLNLGCGLDIKNGWINVDRVALPGVDVVHDLEVLPLPFPDDHFEYILCQDVLEHLDFVNVLRDVWRILKTGGVVHIRVPHFTSPNAYSDPTHKKLFTSDTFRFFVPGERSYYFDFLFCTLQNLRIEFGPKAFKPISWMVNRSDRMQQFYEASPLRIFPAANIEVDLIK
jgi:SAM-dependent methyltransferase